MNDWTRGEQQRVHVQIWGLGPERMAVPTTKTGSTGVKSTSGKGGMGKGEDGCTLGHVSLR